jgi:NADPH:quinone reductase-like Zn-dependent oxidoreductase
VYDRYGPPEEVLRIEEIPEPAIGESEVLVRVRASSVNSWDCDNVRGTPRFARAFGGLTRPRIRILGADVAGEVVAVGRLVTRFEPGDAVLGDLSSSGWGGFAEFASAHEDALVHKPVALGFEQAAAIPQAGVLALQAVGRNVARQDKHVLVNGAGGGVGTFAIQLARHAGARVTGVDATSKIELMRVLGAETVIDYTREDLADLPGRYDLIVDVTAQRSMSDYRRLLAPDGRYVMVGGATSRILQVLMFGTWGAATRSDRRMSLLVHQANRDLDHLAALAAAGTVVPVIDRTYELADVAAAVRRVSDAHALGKVVVTVA